MFKKIFSSKCFRFETEEEFEEFCEMCDNYNITLSSGATLKEVNRTLSSSAKYNLVFKIDESNPSILRCMPTRAEATYAELKSKLITKEFELDELKRLFGLSEVTSA